MQLDRRTFIRILAIVMILTGVSEYTSVFREGGASFSHERHLTRSLPDGVFESAGTTPPMNTWGPLYVACRGVMPIVMTTVGLWLFLLKPLGRLLAVFVLGIDYLLRIYGMLVVSLKPVPLAIDEYFWDLPNLLLSLFSALGMGILSTKFVQETLSTNEWHVDPVQQRKWNIIRTLLVVVSIAALAYAWRERPDHGIPRRENQERSWNLHRDNPEVLYPRLTEFHYHKAMQDLLVQASENGKPCAPCSIAYLHYHGAGRPYDRIQSTYWYLRGLLQGCKRCRGIVKQISFAPGSPGSKALAMIETEEQDYFPSDIASIRRPQLTTQQFWASGTSALLFEENGHEHDKLQAVPWHEFARVQEILEMLSDTWGIECREDLLRQLKRLCNSGTEVVRTQPEGLDRKALVAWDYCRCVSLCRWGYMANFVSEKEAWAIIMPVAKTLQQAFDSWEDLGQGYMRGRMLCFRGAKKDEFISAYERLLSDTNSPWVKLAWDTPLTDED